MSRIFLIFIEFVAFGVQLSPGIVLECNFVYHQTTWGSRYACLANNLETTAENRTITEVKGVHLEGKTLDDVQNFFVIHGKCPLLPLNVGAFFKNLEIFYVMKSEVKTLTNEDLKGLDKLKVFDVSHNPIERIENGYFKGKSSIKIISFYECALRFVDSSTLDPLINLEEGHFQYNHCVDYRGDQKHLLPNLKQHLKYCDGTRNDIDFYPDTLPDLEDEKKEMTNHEFSQSSTTESSVHEIHYINECQKTFIGRNAFLIILLLVLIIIVGIISFGIVQYKTKEIIPYSMLLMNERL